MKLTTITQFLLLSAIATLGPLVSQIATAQLPPIVNNQGRS